MYLCEGSSNMRKNLVLTVLLIISLALVGIVIMQLSWVHSATKRRMDLFGLKTTVSLQNIVNQVQHTLPLAGIPDSGACMPNCRRMRGDLSGYVNLEMLDSLFRKEFVSYQAGIDYHYGIYHYRDQNLILSSDTAQNAALVASPHYVSLSCIYQPEEYVLGVYFPHQKSLVLSDVWIWLGGTIVFMSLMIFGFTLSIFSLIRQKKMSEIKADFLNNMTHEFKTPIATIALASEMLQNPDACMTKSRIIRYANIIHSENDRLRKQVEGVLQMAVIDRRGFKIRKKSVDVHRIIENLIKTFSIVVRNRHGLIRSSLLAEKHIIVADKEHFTNVISNLIDNAEKYSPDAPEINVSTRNIDGGILISVEDRGIGMSPEIQKDIFKKHYRNEDVSNEGTKGFGLGLYYVQQIVEAHEGSVSLRSTPGAGSCFDIFFPFNETDRDENETDEPVGEDIAGGR